MLAWLDVETTGLNPTLDQLLEVGFIITDDDLNELARRAWVLPFDGKVDDFIRNMHTKSGLLAECKVLADGWRRWSESNIPVKHARPIAQEICGWLKEQLKDEKPPLCGSTISFDKSFLSASLTMSHILDLFHYRSIDVSSIKELARCWRPDVYEKRPKPGARHRALPDLEDSIAELRFYRHELFEV